MIGTVKTLNKDLKGTAKTKAFWGRKGEKVKIISVSGNAVIFENNRGVRFPCNIKDIAD